ncbi:MAG: hypothetical protein H0U59_10705 [Gemmatimonadaceae bacterium]|nr:hypothetical protein [Gemmatimonadaceae bacterium]
MSAQERMYEHEQERDEILDHITPMLNDLATAVVTLAGLVAQLAGHAVWETENAENRTMLREIRDAARRITITPAPRPPAERVTTTDYSPRVY